jgi:hypothetical protein
VLLELFRLDLLTRKVAHVDKDGAFEIIVDFSEAFARSDGVVLFPGRMIVSFVLPLDLEEELVRVRETDVGKTNQVFKILLLCISRVNFCIELALVNIEATTCIPVSDLGR